MKLPGSCNSVKNLGSSASPKDIFNCLFTEDIQNEIILRTNETIAKVRAKYKNAAESYLYDMDKIEFESFLGLLYSGAFKSGEDLYSMFSTNGTARDIFHSVMSFNRKLILLSCLRFDNPETRLTRKTDQDAPIPELFQKLISNFQTNFTQGQYICVDEKQSCFFLQCI